MHVSFAQIIKNYLLPVVNLRTTCLLCRQTCLWKERICKFCDRSLPKIVTQCALCCNSIQIFYSSNIGDESGYNILCGYCQKHGRLFDRSIISFPYLPPISFMLHDFKYKGKLYFGKVLANKLIDALKISYANEPWPNTIIPIPLHKKRLISRGYNQSTIIAKILSSTFKIPVNCSLVSRQKNTQSQTELTFKNRKTNMKNAFILKKSHNLPEHIAIVDDIMTSGATAESLSLVLKNGGIKQVDVWCIARTLAN